jgi:uncharacterized protein YaaQ
VWDLKLIFAVVNNDDSTSVAGALTRAGFSATKLATTGGFLRAGNTTLLVGTSEDKVQKAVEAIEKHCAKRKQLVFAPEPMLGGMGEYASFPEEIETGGATIFVVDVERFEKI